MAKITSSTDASKSQIDDLRTSALERTEAQVGLLLEISEQCADIVDARVEVGQTSTVLPRIEESAVRTFEAAHEQLRNLLDDMPRWQADDPDHNALGAILDENFRAARAVRKQREQLLRPSRARDIEIRKLHHSVPGIPSPQWCAWTGGPEPDFDLPHAFGASPAEALKNFDKEFNRRLPDAPPPPAAS